MQQQWYRRRTDKLSAAARRSTKVGGGAHKLSAAARPAHGSKRTSLFTVLQERVEGATRGNRCVVCSEKYDESMLAPTISNTLWLTIYPLTHHLLILWLNARMMPSLEQSSGIDVMFSVIFVKSAQWSGMNCAHALIRSLCPSRTIEISSPDWSIKISTSHLYFALGLFIIN